MCGIAGALVFDGGDFRINERYLDGMRDAMEHRGPDGAGTWISADGIVGLAHRRLSIIDTSISASQPMCNHDETLWVSYNGEIYNHAEIRKELSALRHYIWKTDHSDTEVILHAYAEWGIECIKRFRGMFAIAIWDTRRRQMWLVRDRIGIKPLYYSTHNGRLTFASEIKALLQDPQQRRSVNEEALHHYLSFLTTPAPLTLFDGIHKVPPATCMCFSISGGTSTVRYWDVWDHTTPLTGLSDAEIAERVVDELRTSVALHGVSDVPVGVFLSGGIDSSTNAALFSETVRSPLKTFTVGFTGNYLTYQNEFEAARYMADVIHAEHHDRTLDVDDGLSFLPQMVKLQDEPIADPVCIPLYYVSKLARDHGVKVCQVGEGADELFWGYPSWRLLLKLQRASDLIPVPLIKQIAAGGLRLAGKSQSKGYEFLRRAGASEPIFWSGAEAFTEEQKRALLSPRLKRQLDGLSSWDVLAPYYKRFNESAWEKSHLNWMTYSDLKLRLPELLLMRVDKMGMGASLEARVPFLDHVFVELAMSIPESVKTRYGNLKHILKEAVKGVIPDHVISRRKQGFGAPVQEWYSDKLGMVAREELAQFCSQVDLLDWKAVDSVLRSGRGAKIWYLLNLALWWKEYIADQR